MVIGYWVLVMEVIKSLATLSTLSTLTTLTTLLLNCVEIFLAQGLVNILVNVRIG